MTKTITLRYFASLQEQTQRPEEVLQTELNTCRQLYQYLAKVYGFGLTERQIKVAINDRFADLDQAINHGDAIVFIPPVAGG